MEWNLAIQNQIIPIMNRPSDLITEIGRRLSQYQSEITNRNRNGELDINKEAERFYAPILSEIFDANFEISEYKKQNTPGIDLECEDTKIAFQITSQSTKHSKKVENSIDKFIKNYDQYSAKYDQLYFLFTGTTYSSTKTDEDIQSLIDEILEKYERRDIQISVKNKNIYSVDSLTREIEKRHYYNLNKLEKILEKIEQQLPDYVYNNVDFGKFMSRKLSKTLKSINEKAKKQPDVISALKYSLKQFNNLPVLPFHLLEKLYPFSDSNDKWGHFRLWNYSFRTHNQELFDLVKNIIETQNSGKSISEDDKLVIRFFKRHLIYHLDNGKTEDRLCVHKLKLHTSDNSCSCVKCSFRKLNFNDSINGLRACNEEGQDYENLRNAYFQFKFGNFGLASNLYKQLSDDFKERGEYVCYFICEYNRTNLIKFIKNNYWEEGNDSLFYELEAINLDEILIHLKGDKNLNEETLYVLEYIKNNDFINNSIFRSIKNLDKAVSYNLSDKFGGWFSNSNADVIIGNVAQLSTFIKKNFIIFDDFYDYTLVLHKALEGLIALHTIQNTKSDKYKSFTHYIVNLLVLHGDAKMMSDLFWKYNVKEINYTFTTKSTHSIFCQKVVNLCKSIESEIFDERGDRNYFFTRKINGIIDNMLVLLYTIDIDEEELNLCVEKLINLFTSKSFQYTFSNDYLTSLISAKGESLKNEILEKIIWGHFFCNSKFGSEELLRNCVWVFQEKKWEICDKNILDKLSEFIDNHNDLKYEFNFQDVVHLWKILPSNYQDKFKVLLNKELDESFNINLYYNASISDILGDKFLDRFIELIPEYWYLNKPLTRSNNKENRNYLLDAFINLAYKYNTDLSSKEIQSLHKNVPYYEWLLNIDTFDYSKFDAYWLMRYSTIHYFNRFKKVPQIHAAIIERMNNNPVEGLIRIYFKYFADADLQSNTK